MSKPDTTKQYHTNVILHKWDLGRVMCTQPSPTPCEGGEIVYDIPSAIVKHIENNGEKNISRVKNTKMSRTVNLIKLVINKLQNCIFPWIRFLKLECDEFGEYWQSGIKNTKM